MSNVDDFDDLFADDDDLFGDDDAFGDDDFGFDDEAETEPVDDDFAFEDDDIDLDDDFGSFDDLGDDDLSFDEEEEQRGFSRSFFVVVGLMIFIFLIGFGLVIFLLLQSDGPTEIELTSTQIALENAQTIEGATQVALVRQTESFQTQQAVDAQATETAVAEATGGALTATAEFESANVTATAIAQETADARETELALSATPTPLSAGGGLDIPGTQTAQVAALTQQALAGTQTAVAAAGQPEVTEDAGPPPTQVALNVSDVAATATAIAEQLLGGGQASPTPQEAIPGAENGGDGGTTPPVDQGGGELPQTGLLDDLSSDQGILMVILLAFGLLGVIAVSRTLRTANSRRI